MQPLVVGLDQGGVGVNPRDGGVAQDCRVHGPRDAEEVGRKHLDEERRQHLLV
jgi:hypothetical protein